jgi:hypothetical protein
MAPQPPDLALQPPDEVMEPLDENKAWMWQLLPASRSGRGELTHEEHRRLVHSKAARKSGACRRKNSERALVYSLLEFRLLEHTHLIFHLFHSLHLP